MEKRDINPWVNIWHRPKETMRAILDKDPNWMIIWLAAIAGALSGVFLGVMSWHIQSPLYHTLVVPLQIIFGLLLGILFLYFFGWLYSLTGSWVGGQGSFTDLKSAVGWSNYPFIVSTIFGILSYLSHTNLWLKILFGALNLIAWIWGIVIFIALITEAHRFSIWKAILTLIIGFLLIFAVVMLLALIIPLLKPLFQFINLNGIGF